jgi:hypothetical protein
MAQSLLLMSKGVFGFQTSLGQLGSEAAICQPKTRLFFSVGEKMCKRWFWKLASLSVGSYTGGGSFTREFERQVIICRASPP